MKIIKAIIKFIITLILLAVVSFNLFNYISINFLKNEMPTINGYAFLEVVSGSMEPKFKIGDILIVDTKIEKYKEKDIITFKDVNGSFVTHRIIEINDDEIITKGDANNTIDEAIKKDSIVGKYVYKISGLGAIIKSLKSPFVLAMILLIGILLCVFVSIDSKGNVILTEEEKEYIEFLEYKKSNKEIDIRKINSKEIENKKEEDKKEKNKKTNDKKVSKKKTNNKKSDSKKKDGKKSSIKKK